MVLVSVGEKDAPDPGLILDQIAVIGNDHVNAVHIVVRETHTAVNDNDVVLILDDGHVLADLIQSAKRNDLQFFCHKILL